MGRPAARYGWERWQPLALRSVLPIRIFHVSCIQASLIGVNITLARMHAYMETATLQLLTRRLDAIDQPASRPSTVSNLLD